ncbi:MAG: DUF3052 family protein [Thermoleophilaceae bacterium]|nr:DUF3052 family protein [Thermoleophilaceae bacterium]
MTERDYSHRKLTDKLGIKPGMRVRVHGDVGDELPRSALRADLDIIIESAISVRAAEELLERIRPTISDTTAVWIVTRKKGHANYVKQEDLMPLARSFDLVDNKICSIDDQHSAIRFVVPKDLRTSS